MRSDLNNNSRRSDYERRPIMPNRRLISDVRPAVKTAKPIAVVAAPRTVAHQPLPVRHGVAKSVPARQERSQVLRRDLVRGKKAAGRRFFFNARSVTFTALAVVLFLLGGGVAITQLHTNQKVKAQVQTLAAHATSQNGDSTTASDSDIPAEDTPPSVANYRVSADLPRELTIPGIGVDARIVKLGVKANNQLQVPPNIYDAGWYKGSAKPGETGAVLLDGHVHGPTKPGVFANLKKLKAGDKISIARGDGKVFNYHVVKSQKYAKDKVDMGAAFNSAVPGKPGLNLITCDGTYDQSGEYNDRLVVFAVQD
jgi:LPXTG-site transpeptidase (sortase) family protein